MIRFVRTLPILFALLAGASSLLGQSAADVPVATQFDGLHFRSIGPAAMSGPHCRLRVGQPVLLGRRRTAAGRRRTATRYAAVQNESDLVGASPLAKDPTCSGSALRANNRQSPWERRLIAMADAFGL